MNADGVIKCLYVFKNKLVRMGASLDFESIQPLTFDECVKGFDAGIIPWEPLF